MLEITNSSSYQSHASRGVKAGWGVPTEILGAGVNWRPYAFALRYLQSI